MKVSAFDFYEVKAVGEIFEVDASKAEEMAIKIAKAYTEGEHITIHGTTNPKARFSKWFTTNCDYGSVIFQS